MQPMHVDSQNVHSAESTRLGKMLQTLINDVLIVVKYAHRDESFAIDN